MKFDKIIVYAFFLIVLYVGMATYRHYGLSNDELSCHDLGTFNYYYITEHNNTLLRYSDRDYGPIFEVFIIMIEKALGLSEAGTADMFYLRHYLIFLTFYLGLVFFYLLCKTAFNSRWIGLLAALILVLCPRIYGHAFFNSKDIPFMTFMIMGAYSAVEFLKSPSLMRALMHAFFCALAIDTRIGGILLPAITLFIYTLRSLVLPGERSWKSFSSLICYVLLLALLVILMWPMLWQKPWQNFIQFFHNAAHFRFPYNIFYMGQWISPVNHELPWHYLPMWILATVPLMVLVLFTVGSLGFIASLKKGLKEIVEKPIVLLATLWFFIPLVATMIMRPTIYDGWRHFYFIFPAMIILAIYGWQCLSHRKIISKVLIGFLLFDMLLTFCRMASLHPYEHVYFNQMAAANFKENLKKFQLDSWGVEFRKPLEYILSADEKPSIKVFSSNVFAPVNLFLMPESDKSRIQFVRNPKEADYWILDYYFMDANQGSLSLTRRLFMLNIEGVNIVSVFQPN